MADKDKKKKKNSFIDDLLPDGPSMPSFSKLMPDLGLTPRTLGGMISSLSGVLGPPLGEAAAGPPAFLNDMGGILNRSSAGIPGMQVPGTILQNIANAMSNPSSQFPISALLNNQPSPNKMGQPVQAATTFKNQNTQGPRINPPDSKDYVNQKLITDPLAGTKNPYPETSQGKTILDPLAGTTNRFPEEGYTPPTAGRTYKDPVTGEMRTDVRKDQTFSEHQRKGPGKGADRQTDWDTNWYANMSTEQYNEPFQTTNAEDVAQNGVTQYLRHSGVVLDPNVVKDIRANVLNDINVFVNQMHKQGRSFTSVDFYNFIGQYAAAKQLIAEQPQQAAT